MNRYQKLAWLNLAVIAAAIIITSTAVMIEFHIRGYSTTGLWWFVGILAILKAKPFLFKKPRGQGAVVCDERDSLIVKSALAIAYKIFWFVFILLCFLLFIIIGPKNSVPVVTLPLIAIGSALFIQVVCSIAILIGYGREAKENE